MLQQTICLLLSGKCNSYTLIWLLMDLNLFLPSFTVLSIYPFFSMTFITFSFPGFYYIEQAHKSLTHWIITKWNNHVATTQVKKCNVTSTLETSFVLPPNHCSLPITTFNTMLGFLALYKLNHIVHCLLCLASFIPHYLYSAMILCTATIYFHCFIIFHCMKMLQFIHIIDVVHWALNFNDCIFYYYF